MRLKNWARDKRRAKKAAEEQAERGEMTLVHNLEDPEVDGGWNSREATPMHLDGAFQTPLASQLLIVPPKQSSNSSTLIYDTADIGLASPTGTERVMF